MNLKGVIRGIYEIGTETTQTSPDEGTLEAHTSSLCLHLGIPANYGL